MDEYRVCILFVAYVVVSYCLLLCVCVIFLENNLIECNWSSAYKCTLFHCAFEIVAVILLACNASNFFYFCLVNVVLNVVI